MRGMRLTGIGGIVSRRSRRTCGLWMAGLMAAVALTAGDARAVVVTKASDVCAPAANPCSVTSSMEIPEGLCTNNTNQPCAVNADCADPGFCKLGAVVLDFGVRDVVLSGSGKFDFGTSSGGILCGDFTTVNTGTVIDANGIAGGGSDSGTVKLYSRRLCSAGASPHPCVYNTDCQLGACGTRRCTLGPKRACLGDLDCSIGPCVQKGIRRVCSKNESTRCLTNADCELGTCPVQTTCKNAEGGVINCSTNGDCDFGTCSVGTASITIAGNVTGNSEFPAFLDFRAADNITTQKTLNVAGTTIESDGGEIALDAAFGSITLNGNVNATSGALSTGGDVSLYAGTDVVVNNVIDMTGGDFDGGTLDVDAGRDVIIGRTLSGNAGSGAGFGGEFLIAAGRDIVVSAPSSSNKTLFETGGNVDQFNDAGDGGAQDLTADRNLTLNVNTRILSNGAPPDAVGGDIVLDAGEVLTLNGDIVAKANGAFGGGGTLEGFSGEDLLVGSTAIVDLTGGQGDGGDLQLVASGNMTFAGTLDVAASNAGAGGVAFLDSNGDVTLSGDMKSTSGDGGDLEVNACRITMTGAGSLDAGLTGSRNTLRVGESMTLQSGSLMKAGPGGENRLIYRAASKPPVTSGTITPAATLTVNPKLSPCPVCGNGELDGGETCEDGNTVNGDGCNSQCQNENCVAQTAPQVDCETNADCGPARTCSPQTGFCTPWELCEDGDACTTDTCNTSLGGGTCQHMPRDCSLEGSECTTDSCDALSGTCVHEPDDEACDDGNPCTDDICTVNNGCSGVANSDPCDDGDVCTEDDICAGGECTGTPINGCAVCGDGILNEATEECDDGNDTFTEGEYCGVDCVLIPCGKPTNSTGVLPKASDAQFTLKAAVGQVSCCRRVCDVDNTNSILASDAQRVLRSAVGQGVTLACPTTGGCPP